MKLSDFSNPLRDLKNHDGFMSDYFHKGSLMIFDL